MANSITEIMKRLREGRVVKNTEDDVTFLTKDKASIRVRIKGNKYVLHQWDYKRAWVPFMEVSSKEEIEEYIDTEIDLNHYQLEVLKDLDGVTESEEVEEPEVEKEEIEEAAQVAPSKEFFSKRSNRKFKVTFPKDTLYTELTFFLDFFELDGMTPEEIAEKYGFEVKGSDVIIPAGTYEAQDPPKGEPNTTFYLNMNGELFEFVFDFESDDPETFYINESVKESDEESIEDEDIDEGLFDSKKKKEKQYEDEIKNIFRDNSMRVVTNIISAVETLLEDCADYTSDIQNFTKQVENITKSAANDIKKSPERLFSTLLNTGRKHARDSVGVEELQDILADFRKLQKVPKVGYPAASYLIEKVAANLIPKLEKYADFLKKEYKDNEY